MSEVAEELFSSNSLTTDRLAQAIRPIDQAVLDLLRRESGLGVQELIDRLEVTATAVRQRLDRLVQLKLIERRKVGVGRGRPSYRYFITSLGLRYAGLTYADLALALWHEVQVLPDTETRSALMQRVSKRMGKAYSQELVGESIEDRMQDLVRVLGGRKIPASVQQTGVLPVLEVHACPYPELINGENDRHICEMEQEVLSEALGQPIELSCCRLDGHNSCQFRPTSDLNSVASAN